MKKLKAEEIAPSTLVDPEFAIVGGDGVIVERYGARLEDAMRAARGHASWCIVDERSGTAITLARDGDGLRRWRRSRAAPAEVKATNTAEATTPTIAKAKPRAHKIDEASAWLRELLAAGPMLSSEVDARARELGIGHDMIARARAAVGVACYRVPGGHGQRSPWAICLPGDVPPGARVRGAA